MNEAARACRPQCVMQSFMGSMEPFGRWVPQSGSQGRNKLAAFRSWHEAFGAGMVGQIGWALAVVI